MKPSKIKVVKAKLAKLLPSSFKAISWCGTIYCQSQREVSEINATDSIDSDFKCHETLHVRQAEGTSNSWFVFYWKYCWQWLMNLPLITIDLNAPYKFIPFELEAYRYQGEWLDCKGKKMAWRAYKWLKMKDKRRLAKLYYSKENKLKFTDFIMENIDPLVYSF